MSTQTPTALRPTPSLEEIGGAFDWLARWASNTHTPGGEDQTWAAREILGARAYNIIVTTATDWAQRNKLLAS